MNPIGINFDNPLHSFKIHTTMIQKGKIDVQTENIFPIIKQFLYTEQEIFLRELVSNAVDATTKLKLLASQGKFNGETENLQIEIILDEKAKTLTIKDQGIGMTAEEIDKYINQIAFSSAEDFIKKMKGKTDAAQSGLIGHFGLGFYSAFMVAEKVEIHTKTYKKGAGSKAVKWECDGTPDYTIDECDKTERGTDIILHIADDAKEYLDEYKILDLLKKYCRFLPVPIRFGDTSESVKKEGEKDKDGNDVYETITKPHIINNTHPLWKKTPQGLTDENYSDFYRELYPATFENPLFHIHINVDYPFNLTGILYFPKLKKNFEVQKDKIQLYCNQVFVTDSVENIVPDFLTLLHGVIDSPDIPLNVSRSSLQTDSNVRKISKHITKKVADKLEELFNADRKEFEKKWEDIKIFIEYGMISETSFSDRAKAFVLLKNAGDNYYTLEEYKKLIEATQTDKDKKLVHLYATDKVLQHSFIEKAKNKGYDVLLFDSPIDAHFVNYLEQHQENCTFKRVDADVVDKLIETEDSKPEMKLSEEQVKSIKDVFEKHLEGKTGFSVEVDTFESDIPVMITQPEFMRRMKEMSKLGGMDYMENMPGAYNVVVNGSHPVVEQLSAAPDDEENKIKLSQMLDLALLEHGLLKGEELTAFVKRSFGLMK
jgi:molecular chaperone HtpG